MIAGENIKAIKEEINYNIAHTHPGQMKDLDSGSFTSNMLRLKTEKTEYECFPDSYLFRYRLQFDILKRA